MVEQLQYAKHKQQFLLPAYAIWDMYSATYILHRICRANLSLLMPLGYSQGYEVALRSGSAIS